MGWIERKQAAEDKILKLWSDIRKDTNSYLSFTDKRLERFKSTTFFGIEAKVMTMFYDKTLMEAKRAAVKAFVDETKGKADSKAALESLTSGKPKLSNDQTRDVIGAAEKNVGKRWNFLGSRCNRMLAKNGERFEEIERLFQSLPMAAQHHNGLTVPQNYHDIILKLGKIEPEFIPYHDQIKLCREALYRKDTTISPEELKAIIQYLQLKEMEVDLEDIQNSYTTLSLEEKVTLLKHKQLLRNLSSLVYFAEQAYSSGESDTVKPFYTESVRTLEQECEFIQSKTPTQMFATLQQKLERIKRSVLELQDNKIETVIPLPDRAEKGTAFKFNAQKILTWLEKLVDFTRVLFERLSKPIHTQQHELCKLRSEFVSAAFGLTPDHQIYELAQNNARHLSLGRK